MDPNNQGDDNSSESERTDGGTHNKRSNIINQNQLVSENNDEVYGSASSLGQPNELETDTKKGVKPSSTNIYINETPKANEENNQTQFERKNTNLIFYTSLMLFVIAVTLVVTKLFFK